MGLFSMFFKKKKAPQIPVQDKPEVRKQTFEKTFFETPHVKFSYSVESNIEIPPLQGDYAKAVFLSVYGKASPIRNANDYQRYLLYECGIRDCPAYHRALIDEGYLAASTIEARIGAFKVDELKQMLSAKGLPVSGRKAELIERLLPVADEDLVNEHAPEMTYAITEKGQAFLDEHSAYVYLHKHKSWGISWPEFDKKKRPGYSTRDTIWGILNERVIESKDYGRNEYLAMYQMLVEEDKRDVAIDMLLRIIYIDVSGVEGITYLQNPFWTAKDARDGFSIAVMLAPGLLGDISRYEDRYTDAIVDRLFEWKLPVQICSKALFLELVHSCLDHTFDEEAFLDKLKPAWNKAVKEAKGK